MCTKTNIPGYLETDLSHSDRFDMLCTKAEIFRCEPDWKATLN